ncbi:MAG: hypothetical protein NC336_03900 [Clostridium sp.]|nr:hypothetical protein [Clostridium sp.]
MNPNNFVRLMAVTAVGASLALAGCSDDAAAPIASESTVIFSAELPAGLSSRAFGNGLAVTALTYAVYEHNGTEVKTFAEGEARFAGLKATVSLNLTSGKTYDVVFWAQNPACEAYSFDAGTMSVSIDYDGVTSSDESRDAFFAATTVSISGPSTETVELKRPFAQINLGTTDIDAAQIATPDQSLSASMSVTAFSVLNLFDGSVSEPVTVSFADASAPGSAEPFPGEDAYYLAMNYILCDALRQTADVSFSISEDGGELVAKTLMNVPVQRNYRSNITGTLLTDATVFNVSISPAFDGTLAGGEETSGEKQQAKEPTVNIVDGVSRYQISSSDELIWISQNSAAIDWDCSAVDLLADIDLGGAEWTPIDIDAPTSTVDINGGGHTVSNFSLSASTSTPQGLFGTVRNAVIRDLNVISVVSSGSGREVGAVAGSLDGRLVNVSASGVTLEGSGSVGALVGTLRSGTADVSDDAVISYSVVENSTVSATATAGGLVGSIANTAARSGQAGDCVLVRSSVVVSTSVSGSSAGAIAGTAANRESVFKYDFYTDATLADLGNGQASDPGFSYEADGTTLRVSTIDELRKATKAVTYGGTILLTRDLNLYGRTIEPISVASDKKFTFDGGGHTIRNASISSSDSHSALFQTGATSGILQTASAAEIDVTDIRFEKITSTGALAAAIVATALSGDMNGVSVTGCTVNSSGTGINSGAGALCAVQYSGNMSGCSVTSTTVTASTRAGSLTGQYNAAGGVYENCVATDCQVILNTNQIDKPRSGPIVGALDTKAKLTLRGCTWPGTTPETQSETLSSLKVE